MMNFKHITSRDNILYKRLQKLADSSRERRKENQTLLDGAHLLQAYTAVHGLPKMLIIPEGTSTNEVTGLIQEMSDVQTIMFPTLMFTDLSPVATPTGVIALIDIPNTKEIETPEFVLMLEDIQDPGNLGSMLRSAAAAGVDAVYLSTGCADAWSPKALRGGQGAQFELTIVERVDLPEMIPQFSGNTYAMTLDGVPLYDLDLKSATAFLIGNEGAGLTQAVIEASSGKVSIPMQGQTESLNAAAAASICLFERVRQTRF